MFPDACLRRLGQLKAGSLNWRRGYLELRVTVLTGQSPLRPSAPAASC